jgi:hypothetical protein
MAQINSWAAWILVRFEIVTATFDPEVLQWPGGSVIAAVLWLYRTALWFWSVGTPVLMQSQQVTASVSA